MECLFAECNGIKAAAVPTNINSTGGSAITGARISLKPMQRVSIIVSFNDVAADVAVSFQEHDAATAGNSKAFTIVDPVFVKLDAETAFTKEAFAAADGNGSSGVVVYEIMAESLDRDNGYGYISANVAQAAGDKIVSVMYVSHDMESHPAYSVDL